MNRIPNTLSDHTKGIILAASAMALFSFDALLIRLAGTETWNILFWFGLFTFFSLSMVQFFMDRQGPWSMLRAGGFRMAGISLLMLVNIAAFVVAIKLTTTANVVVLMSTAPFFASIMSAVFLKERPPVRTWIACFCSIVGVVIVFGGSVDIGSTAGNVFALFSTLSVAATLVSLRRFPQISRIGAVCMGGLFTAFLSFLFATPFGLEKNTYLVLAIMGLFQGPLARVLAGTGTRYISAPEVSLLGLTETILAPIIIWFVFGEVPPFQTFLGGGLIVLTLIIHTGIGLQKVRRIGNP